MTELKFDNFGPTGGRLWLSGGCGISIKDNFTYEAQQAEIGRDSARMSAEYLNVGALYQKFLNKLRMKMMAQKLGYN